MCVLGQYLIKHRYNSEPIKSVISFGQILVSSYQLNLTYMPSLMHTKGVCTSISRNQNQKETRNHLFNLFHPKENFGLVSLLPQ